MLHKITHLTWQAKTGWLSGTHPSTKYSLLPNTLQPWSVMTPISLLLTFFLGASLHLTTVSETISWEQLRDVQFKKKSYPEEGVVML